jgi:DNA-binding NarL/FixJ family response regulator
MKHMFLSADARCRDSWQEAFPDLLVGRLASLPSVPASPALVWALLPLGQRADSLLEKLNKWLDGRSLVVLSDEPNEEEAMLVLSAGASGYCNGHAAPQVLTQIATVVGGGGLWVGQALMQRLLAAASRIIPASVDERAPWRGLLTAREQEVALSLARGASNKEIARQLDITERTVKSHVSATLEKLGARDRLQLSLVVNGVDSKH